MTAKEKIIDRLKEEKNLALFQFKIMGCSESAISARLRELASVGLVVGHFEKGEPFKRWNLSQPGKGDSVNNIESGMNAPGLAPVYMTETGGQIEFQIKA